MARRINVIAVFLACATATSATVAPFPRDKTIVYGYDTVVTTSISNDSLYSSQYVFQGIIGITHDTRDPELPNAYNVVLTDLGTEMNNGKTVEYEEKPVRGPIDKDASVIQEPFLIIYNPNGTFQGVKINENEPEWSKNMKMAMATMLQLDLPNINVEKLTNEPLNFVTQEKTIYGDCSVTYDVSPQDEDNSSIPDAFNINKTFSPMECDGFPVHEFNNVENENSKHPMFSISSRDIEIEKQGNGIVIKKLIAYGFVNVLSSNGGSYPHYIFTKTTFDFVEVKEKSESDKSLGDFKNLPIIHDVTYRKPQRSYVPDAAVDVTQGRHIIDLSKIPFKLEKLLIEAVDYLKENHLGLNEMDWNRTQTINKIFRTMSYMNTEALQVAFSIFDNSDLPRDVEIKNIFLGVVSQVGTPASCNFTRNIILKNEISVLTALNMLNTLSQSVKVPTTELLAQMEDLAKFSDPINIEVRKAGILSYSSLIYKTFKDTSHPEDNNIVKKWLHDFLEHVKNEPTYEMKVVYLMAIKNIQIGKIYDLLEPIIKGSSEISKYPERIQLLAIWAIKEAVNEDYTIAHRILWPVMTNKTLSIKLRIAAYEILMNQASDEKSVLNVHQYVSTEGNEHFYNYHYTNLDSIAKSIDSSKTVRKIVRSILENIDYPPKSFENIHYPLSGIKSVGYTDNIYIYAEKIDIGMVVNEFTGQPEVLEFEHVVTDNYGSVSDIAMQVHIEGHHEIMSIFRPVSPVRGVKLTMIRELLEKAAKSLPALKNLNIDIVLMRNGRVLIANHYNIDNLEEIFDDVMMYLYEKKDNLAKNYQTVMFDRLYEKQITIDIGVPVVVETRVPIVKSLMFNYKNLNNWPLKFDLIFEYKSWKHGDYSMSIYNPMKDVWHAVRALTATEVSLPLRINYVCDQLSTNIRHTISFPERPGMIPAHLGYLLRGKQLVTVDEEGTRALMESCPTCRHQEFLDNSSEQTDRPEYREMIADLKSTGLKSSFYVYRCDNGYLLDMDYDQMAEWDISFKSNISNNWFDVLLLEDMMILRRGLNEITVDAEMRSCGTSWKIEPSTNYSISHININLGGDYDDFDKNDTTNDFLHAEKYKINATFDVISNLTNTTARLWKIDFDLDMNRDHLANKASIHISQKTPEEEDLKICIDAKKNYPTPPADELKIVGTNEDIDSKLTITYGYSNEEDCVRNESMISISLKAQLSDEQKKMIKNDMENSACSKDAKNPLYASSKNLIPRTKNCLEDAIRYTTPRKYIFDVTYNEIPPHVSGFMYDYFVERIEPTDSGNFKIQADFPMKTNDIDFRCMINGSEISTFKFNLKNLRRDGNGPVMNQLWDFPLDNSRFNLKYLHGYVEDDIRICSIYPGMVLTGDGENIPFTIPSDEWTLITADHIDYGFAIFAKQTRPNYLSFLFFINNHEIHFLTRKTDDVLVAMADGTKPATDEGLRLPVDENFIWNIVVKKSNDHFVVRLRQIEMTLLVGSNYISIALDSDYQGYISGLCGHLNGTSINNTPEIYSVKEINEY